MWWIHASQLRYNEAQGLFYYLTIRENPNSRRCNTKRSLVVELKALESNACSDYELELNKGNDKEAYY